MTALGAAIRGEWLLDPSKLTVNHGAFGATPRAVLAAQDAWRLKLEAQPSFFMRRILPNALRAAAGRLAAFVGAESCDLVFTENATVGCNGVLRSLKFSAGDEIVMLSHGYGAVRNTLRYLAAQAGATVIEVPIPFPRPSADAVTAAVSGALTARTRLAVLDHITSPSALVLPIEAMVRACRQAGVPVLVDGAHGPGQVGLDLPALGADWYVGNCHKWLMAPKGCGFLWARRDRQVDLHPVTISHGFGKGYLAEFDWTGTRDSSACLAIDAAIDFHQHLGGETLRRRNRALAAEAGRLLAQSLGTEVGAEGEMAGSMAVVRLPIGGPVDAGRAVALRGRLLDEFATDAPVHAMAGAFWMRVSAHAYNEIDDYRRLAEIAAALAKTDQPGGNA